MVIKILGIGCSNCKKLEENTRKAVELLGIEATIEKVTDFKVIATYWVMSTPALVVDERVRIAGRVPKTKEIMEILKQ